MKIKNKFNKTKRKSIQLVYYNQALNNIENLWKMGFNQTYTYFNRMTIDLFIVGCKCRLYPKKNVFHW